MCCAEEETTSIRKYLVPADIRAKPKAMPSAVQDAVPFAATKAGAPSPPKTPKPVATFKGSPSTRSSTGSLGHPYRAYSPHIENRANRKRNANLTQKFKDEYE